MRTDVVGSTEVWIAFRRHPLTASGEPCPGCGMRAVHEMLGVGVKDGEISAEQMAVRLCTEDYDFIGRLPVNAMLPDTAYNLPGAYYPRTGKKVAYSQGEIHDSISD